MTDAELIEFATEFRAAILNGRSSVNMCGLVCWPLTTLLNMSGVKCSSVHSDLDECDHVWIRLDDGRALDPTLDQFNQMWNENFPEVYLGPPTRAHR